MPDRVVKTPGGRTIKVPEDFSPDEIIQAALQVDQAVAGSRESASTARPPRGLMDDLRPIDPATGRPFSPRAIGLPRGTLPVLAGLGSAIATSGLSVPLQIGLTGAAGAAGEGIDAAMHGESASVGSMAMEGAEQAAATAAAPLMRGAGRTAQKVGTWIGSQGPLLSKDNLLTDIALYKFGGVLGGPVAKKVLTDERTMPMVGRAASGVGSAIEKAGGLAARTPSPVGRGLADSVLIQTHGVPVKGATPVVPQILRLLQLIGRAPSPEQER